MAWNAWVGLNLLIVARVKIRRYEKGIHRPAHGTRLSTSFPLPWMKTSLIFWLVLLECVCCCLFLTFKVDTLQKTKICSWLCVKIDDLYLTLPFTTKSSNGSSIHFRSFSLWDTLIILLLLIQFWANRFSISCAHLEILSTLHAEFSALKEHSTLTLLLNPFLISSLTCVWSPEHS